MKRLQGFCAVASLGLATRILFAASAPAPVTTTEPTTPREYFNAGTRLLQAGKLREAEASLETALASQSARLQPPALYNLGHVRFGLGLEELKKGPAAKPAAARGRAAAQMAEDASRDAGEALAGDDVQRMVASYLRGRGVRRELKAATKAVQRALQTYGAALGKWQRSSGDFKSALELDKADSDAQQNADTVDRNIARLVDSLKELEQAAAAMGSKGDDLKDKLKKLTGRIPAPDMPPGAPGDNDDDEDMPNGQARGQKEGTGKEGEQMSLSREQAGWLLEGFKLDSEHRLPMGQESTAPPKTRSGRTW